MMSTILQRAPEVTVPREKTDDRIKSLDSDVVLIEKFEQGNRDAFDELIHRYYGPALKIAYGFVTHRETTRDIVQEAFAKAYKALPGYDHGRPFSTWFFRIVTNLCIDKLRRRRYRNNVSLENARQYNLDPASEEQTESQANEVREAVRDIMDSMPDKYLTVLTMRDMNNFNCEKIADILHVSPSTIRWRLATARRIFKEKWRLKYHD